MPVNTAKVQGRRKLSYASFDALIADAEEVASGPVRALGNWSPGQVFSHLAKIYVGSIDGLDMPMPWYLRLGGRLARPILFRIPLPAGFRLDDQALRVIGPEAGLETQQGLDQLRAAIHRLQTEPKRVPHPLFGRLSREQWDAFHLKHAALHMSFLLPG